MGSDFDGKGFQTLGEWFLSDLDSEAAIGTLSFCPTSGLELRIVNPKGKNGFRAIARLANEKEVNAYGHTHSHGHITLCNGFVRSTPSSSHGPSETVYFFNYGLLGVAEPYPDKLEVKSVFATSDLLRAFLNKRVVVVKSKFGSRNVTISHKLPKTIRYKTNDGFAVEFAWDRDGPTQSLAQASIMIKSRPWVGADYRSQRNLKSALADIESIGRLLTSLCGIQFKPSLIIFHRRKRKPDLGTAKSFYFLATPLKSLAREKDIGPLDLVFRFTDVAAGFEQTVTRWMKLQKEIPGCLNVFFSASYSTFTNQRLFAMTAALEALHRKLVGNEATLRERVMYFLQLSPSLSIELVGDIAKFASQVVSHRNAEAHCNETSLGESGSRMARMGAKLKVLFDFVLLSHVGIPSSEIVDAMKKTRECWWYASNDTWNWDVA